MFSHKCFGLALICAKIVPARAMRACFLIAERSLFSAKIVLFVRNTK
ncbi:hypothetical protein HMPREF1146_2248 [Prevotella sp. MSX73]|nr:hypothetical protein HMPREF1146_2248 [Prevotella sp. MSX73]